MDTTTKNASSKNVTSDHRSDVEFAVVFVASPFGNRDFFFFSHLKYFFELPMSDLNFSHDYETSLRGILWLLVRVANVCFFKDLKELIEAIQNEVFHFSNDDVDISRTQNQWNRNGQSERSCDQRKLNILSQF